MHAEDEEDHDHEHDEEHGDHEEHGHHEHDTHVWLSPVLSKELALSIKNELVDMLPEQQELFTKNYEELAAELDTLHADFEAMAKQTTKKTFLYPMRRSAI